MRSSFILYLLIETNINKGQSNTLHTLTIKKLNWSIKI